MLKTIRRIIFFLPFVLFTVFAVFWALSKMSPSFEDVGIIFGLPAYFALISPGIMIARSAGVVSGSMDDLLLPEGSLLFIVGFWVIYELAVMAVWSWWKSRRSYGEVKG